MDYQTLREAARESLDKAPYNPKKLALIHVGISLLVSLVLTVTNLLLARSFNASVGLGNLGHRAVLQTVQTVLSFANMLLTPMWTIGFFAVALRTARWSNAEPRDLLDGFRHWGTVLRLCILHICLILLLVFACSQIAATIFAITPLSRELTRVMEQAMQNGQDPMLMVDQLPLSAMIPLFILLGASIAVVGIPLFYRFRLSFFAVSEGVPSARKAMAQSAFLMRDNRKAMFRLDLHFWWYYGALLLISALGMVDVLPESVTGLLPFSRNVLIYGAYGLYLVLHLLIQWRFSMEVRTTYAHCYDQLKAERLPPEPQADPSRNPWTQSDN